MLGVSAVYIDTSLSPWWLIPWLGPVSQGHEKLCHDSDVMGLNFSRAELGVSIPSVYVGLEPNIQTVFTHLSASSPMSTWFQMSTVSNEGIMIMSALKNESKMSAGFK